MSWEELCQLLLDRFGKQEHEILIRRLFHIRQTSTVTAYIDQFAQLLDQLCAYQTITGPLYYTMKFLDGLKDDIKSTVMIQRPKDLDTAFVLAQLQEEVGDTAKKRELHKWDLPTPFRSYSKGPMPLPPPPDKNVSSPATVNDKMVPVPAKNSTTDERLSNLYAYRKAQGLCYKCGMAYSKGHKCLDVVHLHLVEELWQQLDLSDPDDSPDAAEAEIHTLFLSQSAAGMTISPKTMKFRGSIQGLELLILLDSGSSHTFLNVLVALLVNFPMPVQVANGHRLRGFLGLAGYYHKFVWHFGIIAKTLTNLLKKNTPFVWTGEHEQSFQALKTTLSTTPVLALPDFDKQFAIESDASGTSIGAVLTQEGCPLAFVSKALSTKTQGLSTYEKEYLAVILAVNQWRPYLQHLEFIIFSDQRSLSHLSE
jgi:hypothetical protein